MGRIKTKFNTDDLFLEGQHSSTEKQDFIQSPLFPIVATMYNTTDRAIRVGHITKNDTFCSALITSVEGFVVGKIRFNRSNSFDYSSTSNGTTEPSSNVLVSSTSANYIRAKLSKNSDHVAASWLRRNAIDAPRCVSNTIRNIADSVVDRAFGKSLSCRPYIEFSSEITTFLSDVVMNKKTMSEMSADMRQSFDAKYSQYEESCNKFNAAIDKAKTFFDQDKWVLVRDVNRGVILCAITPDNTVAALDIYKLGDGLPHDHKYDYANYSIKPKWYPCYDAIPEEYRRELDYSLMMLKVHTRSNSMIPEDPQGIWMDIGAANYGQITVLPK